MQLLLSKALLLIKFLLLKKHQFIKLVRRAINGGAKIQNSILLEGLRFNTQQIRESIRIFDRAICGDHQNSISLLFFLPIEPALEAGFTFKP